MNKIISILQKGYDDDNNKVTNNDIEYLDKYTPDILRTYIAKKSSDTNHKKYQYLNYTATNNSQKINCSVSKDGNTKTYEIADGTKDTLDWETAYNMRYPQGNDIFYEMVTGNLQDNLEHNSELKSKTSYTKGDIITEDQYFDPSSTEKFHMGRIMSINDEVKYFKNVSKCWMSKEGTFPINLDQLSPLVKFANFVIFDELSQINKNSFEMALYERFIEIMKKDLQGDRRFPLKIGKY